MKKLLVVILFAASALSLVMMDKPQATNRYAPAQRKQGPVPCPPCVDKVDVAMLAHGTYGRSRE